MSDNESFADLLARTRQGDNGAAAVIFERFVSKLADHADRHLASATRRHFDPEDVVQSVYRTFFRRARKGQFHLDHWGSLWGLLTRISLCKCARAATKVQSRPNHVSFGADSNSSNCDSSLEWEAIAREPSPAESAALADTLDALMKPLRDSHRKILTLTLQGFTQEEIGNRVGCSQRTVRRVLAQAQVDLERLDLLVESKAAMESQ